MIHQQDVSAEAEAGVGFLDELISTPEGDAILGCMQCGTCSGSCPLGTSMEYPPRRMILQARAGDMAGVLASPSVWMCVGCYTCTSRCPREIDLTDTLWPAVRDRALRDGFQPPSELQTAFQNLYIYGNVLGQSPRKRLAWAKDLDVPLIDLSKDRQPVERNMVGWRLPFLLPAQPACEPRVCAHFTRLERSFWRVGCQGKIVGRLRPAVWRRGSVRDACRVEQRVVVGAAVPGAGPARSAQFSRVAAVLSKI